MLFLVFAVGSLAATAQQTPEQILLNLEPELVNGNEARYFHEVTGDLSVEQFTLADYVVQNSEDATEFDNEVEFEGVDVIEHVTAYDKNMLGMLVRVFVIETEDPNGKIEFYQEVMLVTRTDTI